MSIGALQRRAREARSWLFEACFPLWAEAGLAREWHFVESLDLGHRPTEPRESRVRVQARQGYVFAEAHRLGWDADRARALCERATTVLAGPARRADGLYGRRLSADGQVLSDDTADLYDTAFALFALAHLSDALRDDPRPLTLARATLDTLDRTLRDTRHGGYAEALPRPDQRLQNPHMHLFEACLALAAADRSGHHLGRASALFALFVNRFVGEPGGLLGERFAPDWSALDGDAHDVVEPGHQFEWVWLLARYAAATRAPLAEEAGTLYRFACSTLDADGHAVMEVRRSGEVVNGARRTWVQTEALKAHLAWWQAHDDEAALARAVTSFDLLMDEHLTPEGGWIDTYDADGRPVSPDMPASTGYHVVLALACLMDAAPP